MQVHEPVQATDPATLLTLPLPLAVHKYLCSLDGVMITLYVVLCASENISDKLFYANLIPALLGRW